jgi:hypothetical protein
VWWHKKAKKEEEGGFKQSCMLSARHFVACTCNQGKRSVSVGTATAIGRCTAQHEGQGGWQPRWAGLGNGSTALSAAVAVDQTERRGAGRRDPCWDTLSGRQ